MRVQDVVLDVGVRVLEEEREVGAPRVEPLLLGSVERPRASKPHSSHSSTTWPSRACHV